MRGRSLLRFASVALCAAAAVAQTITTTDELGQTIVEVLTLDQLGLPTTQIIATLTGDDEDPATSAALSSAASLSSSTTPLITPTSTALTSTTSSATPVTVATTAPDDQQGPVGAPPATTAAGPTIYTYTTTDANGETIAVEDTFTATFPSTTPFTAQSTGTILPYSVWLSIYGGGGSGSSATVGADTVAQSGGAQRLGLGRSAFGIAAGVLAGLLGGAWLVAV